MREPVFDYPEVLRISNWQEFVGWLYRKSSESSEALCLVGQREGGDRQVLAAAHRVAEHDCRERDDSYATSAPLGLHVVGGDDGPANAAGGSPPRRADGRVKPKCTGCRRFYDLIGHGQCVAVHDGLEGHHAALLLAKPGLANEVNAVFCKRRVGTADSACPQVSQWCSAIGRTAEQVIVDTADSVGDRWVDVGEIVPGTVDPDLAPATHVVGEPRVGLGVLEHHPLDQVRDGVEFIRRYLASESGGLKRDCPAARKQVDHFGWLAPVRGEHLLSRLANRRLRAAPAAERVEELRKSAALRWCPSAGTSVA